MMINQLSLHIENVEAMFLGCEISYYEATSWMKKIDISLVLQFILHLAIPS